MQRRIVCLMGPTASGKTALAIELVKRYPFEIISVDSALVFKGLDIGAAKPTASELAEAPHRLISFLDPSESYSAARFREDAIRHIHDIWRNGKIPLFVGGTMLYFRTLLLGMSDLPEANPAIRAEIDATAAEYGWDHVHQLLAEVDPVSAERLRPSDAQRVQRALEVFKITGKPISDFHDQTADHKTQAPEYAQDIGVDPIQLAIMPEDRAVLHQRIETRFHQMLKDGFLDEVKALYMRGDLDTSLPAIRAVGFRQAWSYLEAEIDYDEMVYRGIVATRQLAKRQMTWLRNWYGVNMFLTDSSSQYVVNLADSCQLTVDAVSDYLCRQITF